MVNLGNKEAEKYSILLKTVRTSVEDVVNESTSAESEETWRGILHDKIPHRWLQFAYPVGDVTLSRFLKNLKERFEFVLRWGEKGSAMRSYWLPGFYQQEAFFSAILELNSRRLGVEWRSLGLDFEVTHKAQEKDLRAPAEEGAVYVHGLYLEGALYDSELGLVEPPLDGKYRAMPLLKVKTKDI